VDLMTEVMILKVVIVLDVMCEGLLRKSRYSVRSWSLAPRTWI
jgi:hypothetical protein